MYTKTATLVQHRRVRHLSPRFFFHVFNSWQLHRFKLPIHT